MLQPLKINVVSLPKLVNRQREDLVKLLEQTSSQMRSTKILNSNLLESHIRHKRKLEKSSESGLERTLKKLRMVTNKCDKVSPTTPRLRRDKVINFEVRRRLAEKFNKHRQLMRDISNLSIDP